MSQFRNILWGLVFIILGAILALGTLDIVHVHLFFDGWWTLFIIIPCFIDLFKKGDKTGNLIGLMIGVLLLFACQDKIDFQIAWQLFLPIVLVVIGFSCIFKNIVGHKRNKTIYQLNKNRSNNKEYCSTFSGQKLDFSNETVDGFKLSAIFGGIDCDLREAIIEKDVVIQVSSIFGGIDLYVPKDINVKVNSTSIFGGVDNKVKNHEKNDITIYIQATCLFGGVEIK